MKIAFQGERGAYSEEGVWRVFGSQVQPLPLESFADLFSAVTAREARFAVLPVENSQAGSVVDAYDLLLAHDHVVVGEVLVPVDHCLMALPGQELADIREVMSHPQALAQSAEFLRRLGARPTPSYDTAGSARIVASEGRSGVGAIASQRAAALYGLEILARSIQTVPDNFTRMFVLASSGARPLGPPDKTSLVFGLPHEAGALYRALGAFATRQLSMTKIESRPSRKAPWEYVFYVDFEGDPDSSDVLRALDELRFHSKFLKVLGSYPKAAAEKPA